MTTAALAGRTALVTGAGRGIGRAIAERLAAAGATVVLCGRDERALADAAEHIGNAVAIPVDVTDEASVARLRDRAGTPDVVVCNSGIGGPSAPVWRVEPEDWGETFAVNVTGTFLTLRAFLPGMVERGRGSAILIGSMTGKRPLENRAPYAASKMAMLGLCRTAALDAGPYGVRVNLVSPGFVEGPRLDWVIEAQAAARGEPATTTREHLRAQSPLGIFVEAGDVAEAVLFLASDAAMAITGADLNVSAGLVMH